MTTMTISTVRSLARLAGYFVREGAYQGTSDDRLGRWYVGHEDDGAFRPYGEGYDSAGDAWRRAYGHAIDCGALGVGEDSVTFVQDEFRRVTAHRLANGRWLLARFDKQSQEWRSGDLRRSTREAKYLFARTLQALADDGIKTYPSAAAAIRADLYPTV